MMHISPLPLHLPTRTQKGFLLGEINCGILLVAFRRLGQALPYLEDVDSKNKWRTVPPVNLAVTHFQ